MKEEEIYLSPPKSVKASLLRIAQFYRENQPTTRLFSLGTAGVFRNSSVQLKNM